MSTEHLPDLVAQLTPSSSEDGETTPTVQRMDEIIELNIIEVYDQARLIRADFEKIAEVYGADLIRDLVQRVNRLIKLLESQVTKNEKSSDDLLAMKKTLNSFQFDRNEVRKLRKKHQDELDAIDDQWSKENEKLTGELMKFQKENQRLRQEIQHRSSNPVKSSETIAFTREDLQAIENLTEQNLKLNSNLKIKEKELKQTSTAFESMRLQFDSLAKTNATLKRQQTFATTQIKRLTEEKLELEVRIREKENFIHKIQIEERPKEEKSPSNILTVDSVDDLPEDLTSIDLGDRHFSIDVVRQIIWEKIELKQKLMHTEDELQLLQEQLHKLTSPPPPPKPSPLPSPSPNSSKRPSPFWTFFLLLPIIICFSTVLLGVNALRRAIKTTNRRGSLSDLEQSSLSSPMVQSGVLMAKSSLPLRSPQTSFNET